MEERVLVDGFCCQIALLNFHEGKAPGILQEVYVVELILEVVGEEA
ncbi:hypothetical protein [Deinococcus cellulosilyticus]|uniref:Uncharacterized protein n=1 Tax=Deinococcus cellulosilyticus (strain DSM 18568 / NBRC 106333 / KACC 11606 / 5516J-15) TaxID=1223518 RepID=A0A511NB22_DEIC1|nr:hypothetical protein [Deinococcus cellulosilyticus]GEM49787.1 hypothetical protein DC3_54220 [Deinococcus cellulosilyticus NBRC 106333 = KACC 11606]